MKRPSLENLTTRLLGPSPSVTKISPFGATATPLGRLNVSGPCPVTPVVPSVIKTSPSGLSFTTTAPIWLGTRATSVTHMFPRGPHRSREVCQTIRRRSLPGTRLKKRISRSAGERPTSPSNQRSGRRSARDPLQDLLGRGTTPILGGTRSVAVRRSGSKAYRSDDWLARRRNGPIRKSLPGSRPRAAHGPRVTGRVAASDEPRTRAATRCVACSSPVPGSAPYRTRSAASHTRTDAPPSPAPMPCASRPPPRRRPDRAGDACQELA